MWRVVTRSWLPGGSALEGQPTPANKEGLLSSLRGPSEREYAIPFVRWRRLRTRTGTGVYQIKMDVVGAKRDNRVHSFFTLPFSSSDGTPRLDHESFRGTIIPSCT